MNKIVMGVIGLAMLAAGLMFWQHNKQTYDSVEQSSNAPSESHFSWQEFKPQSGLFKVLLPESPRYANDLVTIPGSDQKRRYEMYASEKIDGTGFIISVITYPEEPPASESIEILKQTVNELARSKADNQLSKLTEGLFQEQQALNFTIVNKDFHVEGKAFMSGKRVYVLSYVAKTEEFDSAEYDRFVDSFELLDRQLEEEVKP